jgi:ATP-dependent RNA helicase DOB1
MKLKFLVEKINEKPAKEYEFKLDAFQQQAILCLENNQSVLVVNI